MANSCKYYKQRREMSYDGVTWIPLDEYRKGDLVPGASSDCSSPTPTLYRWVQTENTVCVENQDTTYTKYYVYKKQQQVNGQWVDVYPSETKPDGYPLGTYDTLAECQGYVPPTPTGSTKFRAVYEGGTTYEIPCDGNTTLTSGDTKPSGYQYTAMTSAEIGNCNTSIGTGCFLNCSGLTSVTIPNSVTSIGDWAFSVCSSLTDIVIPNSVTSIGAYAFSDCYSATNVTIGSGVTYIGEQAFGNCFGLTSVIIPSSVGVIESRAFTYCTGLTSITCLSTIPPSLGNLGYAQFYNTNNCPIFVPQSSLSAYLSADGWSNYSDRLVGF